jgi:UDP-GlcNAc:undecaprenyl-phosphate GlcNAc-1-phosphate transferase
MILLTTLLLSLFITMALIPIFKSYAFKLNAIDIPNGRSVHSHPKPKIGGLAMAAGVLIPVLLLAPSGKFIQSLLMGSALIVIFGFIDDQRDLNYKSKFAGQIIAALIVILYGGLKIKSLGLLLPNGALIPDYFSIPLTLFVIIGVTNAMNLSDGLDGLAGGIALLCFICIGLLAYQSGNYVIAVFSVAVIGAIFAFLRFNTHPAVIFMGDAGSLLLGFLAISLSLSLTQGDKPISPLFPLFLFGVPVLDTIRVMLNRLSEGRSPFVADKKHLHHKLINLGLFHSEAVFTIYILQAILITVAFIFRFYSEWFLFIFYLVFAGGILSWLAFTTKTGWRFNRHDLLEGIFKGRLSVLREKTIFIKISYWAVLLGLPAMLLFTCLVPGKIPSPFHIISFCLACLTFLIMLLKAEWIEKTLRLAMYFLVPLLVYQSHVKMVPWLSHEFARIYHLSFVFLVFFVIWMLKLTRRQNGFKTTPTDFLILFIALIVPNLPDAQIQSYQMGLFAAKIIALLFSYEVLVGELRGELHGFGLTIIAALLVVWVRGFV